MVEIETELAGRLSVSIGWRAAGEKAKSHPYFHTELLKQTRDSLLIKMPTRHIPSSRSEESPNNMIMAGWMARVWPSLISRSSRQINNVRFLTDGQTW